VPELRRQREAEVTSLSLADAGIAKPGLYQLSHETYHADPCIVPSLSSSIASTLLDESPRHAWQSHPRLNPSTEPETRAEFDLGSAAHAVMLNDTRGIQVIDADSYRTNAAKAERTDAYAAGKIPILRDKWPEVQAMVAAGRAQIAAHHECPGLFVAGAGKPEQTLVWQEAGVWCRCRLDWRPNDNAIWPDYKSTGASANPEAFARRIFDMGYDLQLAFYRRGIRAILGIDRPTFVFVVQETKPPYALSIVGLDPAALDFADKRVDEALATWDWCLKNDRWPGYASRICWAEVPAYVEHRQAARELNREQAQQSGKAIGDHLLHWQAPPQGDAA
jgi:hypothetical protein